MEKIDTRITNNEIENVRLINFSIRLTETVLL